MSIDEINSWISPRLGMRFQLTEETLILYRPDDQPFTDYIEVQQQLEAAEIRVLEAESRATVAEERAKRLEQLLREAGMYANGNE